MMGEESEADWQAGLVEWGIEDTRRALSRSWYCDQCSVEVYQLRCVHCGKTKRQRR